jgi:hypothetical protein
MSSDPFRLQRRRPFPKRWKLDLRRPLRGRVVYLRRSDDTGRVHLLGHTFDVDATWPGRLVRVEIDFGAKQTLAIKGSLLIFAGRI